MSGSHDPEYMRLYRAKRRAEGMRADDPRHGTVNGYDNGGCRQPCCRAAMAKKMADWRERKARARVAEAEGL